MGSLYVPRSAVSLYSYNNIKFERLTGKLKKMILRYCGGGFIIIFLFIFLKVFLFYFLEL